jgi:hypothetical protein
MAANGMPRKASLPGLPPEIRRRIFSLVVQPQELEQSDTEEKWLSEHLGDLISVLYSEQKPARLVRNHKGESLCGQLLRVSRTCYAEAAPLLYGGQGFYLFNDYDWAMWWRVQPSLCLPTIELFHTQHLTPHGFAFIRELAFQPTPEISVEFVRAIEKNFPSLHTLRAFRHIYVHDPHGRLTGELPEVWREFHRFVLLASLMVTRNHSRLKYAKWSDRCLYPHANAEDSIRTITVKLAPDNVLSMNEVCC